MTNPRSAKSVWTMLVLPPLTLALFIGAYAALAGLSPSDPNAEQAIRSVLGPIIIINHLGLFALLVVLLRRDGETLRGIGWDLSSPQTSLLREVLLGLVCGLGLYLFKEFVVDSIRALSVGNRPTFTSLFRFSFDALDYGLIVAAAGVVFVEESIYRGYALPYFEDRWGTVAAVAISSLAFGPLHWGNGLGAMANAVVYGVLLAGIFLWRRNLVAGTVAHGLYNVMVLLT